MSGASCGCDYDFETARYGGLREGLHAKRSPMGGGYGYEIGNGKLFEESEAGFEDG